MDDILLSYISDSKALHRLVLAALIVELEGASAPVSENRLAFKLTKDYAFSTTEIEGAISALKSKIGLNAVDSWQTQRKVRLLRLRGSDRLNHWCATNQSLINNVRIASAAH